MYKMFSQILESLKDCERAMNSSLRDRNLNNQFSEQFSEVVTECRKTGYNMAIVQEATCLVSNTITVGSFDSYSDCVGVGRASV